MRELVDDSARQKNETVENYPRFGGAKDEKTSARELKDEPRANEG